MAAVVVVATAVAVAVAAAARHLQELHDLVKRACGLLRLDGRVERRDERGEIALHRLS